MNEEQWDDKRAHKLSLWIWISQLQSVGGFWGKSLMKNVGPVSCIFLERGFIHFFRFTKWSETPKDRDAHQLILLLLLLSLDNPTDKNNYIGSPAGFHSRQGDIDNQGKVSELLPEQPHHRGELGQWLRRGHWWEGTKELLSLSLTPLPRWEQTAQPERAREQTVGPESQQARCTWEQQCGKKKRHGLWSEAGFCSNSGSTYILAIGLGWGRWWWRWQHLWWPM